MSERAAFASVAQELSTDTAWARRVRRIAFWSALRVFCLRALSSNAAAAGTWGV